MKYVIGMFDDPAHAAIAEGKVSGLARIERLSGSHTNSYSMLKKYGISGSDLDSFSEGIRRGSTLLVAHCEDANAPKVAQIFRGLPSVDINRRADRWLSTGWKGYDEKASLFGRDETMREHQMGREELHVPVIEEQIAVGKREVESGGVRVQTHVTEKPFEQNVALHQENVTVERHAVNRPVTAADKIGDKVVEMRAQSEEAVVQKSARVVEEVVLKKEETTRNEAIRDTVKRTDVEVKPIAGDTKTTRTSRTSVDRPSQI
jgi:uncharacterized protein (TIGR02271 family)